MTLVHIVVSALILSPAGPQRAKATPEPAKAPATAAADPAQAMLASGALKGLYNPVLLSFLAEEAKGKLPEAQRAAAIEQLVAGFRQQVQVKKSAVATAHLATAVGMIAGGSVGHAIADSTAQIWRGWVDAAFVLQKAGYKPEAAAFFDNCIATFALPELRARCVVGLAAQEPDKAFDLVLGMVNDKDGKAVDEDAMNLGLVLLGEMAGSDALPKEQKDRAVDELVKRTKGFSNTTHKVAAAQGLVASRDPRAVEPLRALTKGTFKDRNASDIAIRGLFLVFKDDGATQELQKQLKGGFLSQPKDQVPAAITLIEGGNGAGFEWAQKFLSKKRKDEEVELAVELVRALGAKGGEEARRVLAAGLAGQKPKDWLAAAIAIQLVALGDDAGLEVAKATLARKEWPPTRMEAAVVLARRGDPAGIEVLTEMAKPEQGIGAKLKLLGGGNGSDPEALRMDVADALGRVDRAESVPVLVGLLADKSAPVRSSAAEALSRVTDPAALDGIARALDVDYGSLDGRSVNPEQHALLVRAAALRFPKEARLGDVLRKAAGSEIATVKFLALAETKTVAR